MTVKYRNFDKYAVALLTLGTLAFCPFSLRSQTITAATAPGVPAHATFYGEGNEHINLGNGNLHVEIPLYEVPGRNGNGVSIRALIDTGGWSVQSSDNVIGDVTPVWRQNDFSGLRLNTVSLTSREERIHSVTVHSSSNYSQMVNVATICETDFEFQDEDGSVHNFGNRAGCYLDARPDLPFEGVTPPEGDNFSSTHEGNGGLYRLDTAGPTTVWTGTGTRYEFNGVPGYYKKIDSNGNVTTYSPTTVVDTVGRQMTYQSGVISYKDSNGQPQTVTVSTAPGPQGSPLSLSVGSCKLPTDQEIVNPCDADEVYEANVPIYAYPQVTLDGSQTVTTFTVTGGDTPITYRVTMNKLGEPTRIEYPDGGYVRYDYQTVKMNDVQNGAAWTCTNYDHREVAAKHRCTNSSGVCSYADEEHTYFQPTTHLDQNSQNIVSNSDGTQTKVVFSAIAYRPSTPVETSRVEYDSALTIQRQTSTEYNGTHTGPYGSTVSVCCQPSKVTITDYSSGVPIFSKWTEYTYTSLPLIPTVWNPPPGTSIPTDYASFAGPSSTKITDSVYGLLQFTSTEMFQVDNANNYVVAGHPSTETTHGTGSFRRSTYLYDSDIPTATSAISHQAPIGIRGNLSSVVVNDGTPNPLSKKSFQYDDTGNAIVSYDGLGTPVPTYTSFADSFSEGSCAPSGSALAYPTKVTNVLGQYVTTSYNSCTGTVGGATDVNRVPVTFTYDGLDRLKTKTYLDGGEESYVYVNGSAPSVTMTTKMDATRNYVETTQLDGIDRPLHHILQSDVSPDITDYEYDKRGRIASVSNPYRLPIDGMYGVTHFHYDALGRPYEKIQPDSSTIRVDFHGNSTTTHDEANNTRELIVDGLGKLRTVNEPNPNGTGVMPTTYSYNLLGDLTDVTQAGDGLSTPVVRKFQYDNLSRLTNACNPEAIPATSACDGTMWSLNYTYDNNGNLETKTDTRNVVVHYGYDLIHRLLTKTYTGNTTAGSVIAAATGSVQYTYDQTTYLGYPTPNGVGRRVGMHDGIGDTAYGYDLMGRPASIIRSTTGLYPWGPYTYSYNLDGTPDVTFGWKYAYNNAGRPTALTYGGYFPIVTAATYTPAGGLATISRFAGGALVEQTQYNNRQQATVITANLTTHDADWGAITNTIQSLTYGYIPLHNNGNITDVVDGLTPTNSQHYTYDSLNRLKTASASGWSQSYAIDPFGNLTSMGSTGMTSGLVAGKNQLSSFSYDAAGNMTSGAASGVGYSYDAEGQLVKAGSWNYRYDGDGRRAKKFADSSPDDGDYYFYGVDGKLIEQAGDSYHSYMYFGSKLIYAENDDGDGYPLSNHLGTNTLYMDMDGAVSSTEGFLPFGASINGANPNQLLKFTGKERDQESGLDYFGARYYASSMGRWMSPDWASNPSPIPYADLGDPQSLNLYMYGGNNPLSDIDFDGHNWFTQFAQGLADSTYRPIMYMVEHPRATAQGLGTAIAHPFATAQGIGSAIKTTAVAAAHGDGRAWGRIVGTVGTAIAGGAVARGVGVAGEVGAEAGEFVGEVPSVTATSESTMYLPAEDLPRDVGGNFRALTAEEGAQGPHTTLGTTTSSRTGLDYRRAMTWDENGKATGRYDFTDHGEPDIHPNPHYHPIAPNGKVGGAQPMPQ